VIVADENNKDGVLQKMKKNIPLKKSVEVCFFVCAKFSNKIAWYYIGKGNNRRGRAFTRV